MIKVDVVSGFLGAGKTTFIKHMVNAISERNEKVVVIENEFGDIGIDGKILDVCGLTVYEIASGCICCSLKEDFISTLIKVAEHVKPDRIIIEPSGIFVLSEMFDVMKHPDIQKKLYLNNVITVIDGENFLKQRHKYGYFFENQVRYASKLVLSKTENISDSSVTYILEELQKVNPSALIYANDWSEMEALDFIALLESENNPDTKDIPNKEHSTNDASHGHHSFIGMGLTPVQNFTVLKLRSKLSMLDKKIYGIVLRAKGFVNSGNQMLELHYVNGKFSITKVADRIDPSICFIGENLNRQELLRLFK